MKKNYQKNYKDVLNAALIGVVCGSFIYVVWYALIVATK